MQFQTIFILHLESLEFNFLFQKSTIVGLKYVDHNQSSAKHEILHQ